MNKVLLEHGHLHSLSIVYSSYKGRVELRQRLYGPQSQKCSLALRRESVAVPGLHCAVSREADKNSVAWAPIRIELAVRGPGIFYKAPHVILRAGTPECRWTLGAAGTRLSVALAPGSSQEPSPSLAGWLGKSRLISVGKVLIHPEFLS